MHEALMRFETSFQDSCLHDAKKEKAYIIAQVSASRAHAHDAWRRNDSLPLRLQIYAAAGNKQQVEAVRKSRSYQIVQYYRV